MNKDFEFAKKMSDYGDLLRGCQSIYARKTNSNIHLMFIAACLTASTIFFFHSSPYKYLILLITGPFFAFQLGMYFYNDRRHKSITDLLINCHNIISYETLDAMSTHVVNKYMAGIKVKPSLMRKYADMNS